MNDPELEEVLVDKYYNLNEDKKMKHNLVMWLGLVVTFLTGAISANQNGLTLGSVLVMISSGLMAVSHAYDGNTGN